MKKFISVLLLIVLFTVNTITIFAENATITANVENTGRSVTVTGNISTGAEKQISIYLTDANGNIAYVNQIESGANGDFAITFSLAETAIEGTYNLTVGGTNVETPARLSFTYEKQRVQFVDADVNVTISGYVPSISGTVYCTEGKTITLSIINKTDDTTVANETITSETGVFDLSYTLPSLLNPKEYVVLVSCAENNSSLADMSVTIDSSILALEVSGTVSTAENVNVDAELQSVNTGLIDKSETFTGSKSVSVTIPNILSTASFHLVAKGYEAVEASEEEPIPDPDPEPEPEPGDDTNVNFENAAEIKPNAVVYEIITENSKNKYIADLKAEFM